MRCSGVGTGSQTAEWNVRHRICLGEDRVDRFEAPELPDSHTPALLGQISMAKKRVILDTFTKKFYMVGPGGYEIRLSPGSQVLDMAESKTGHLMLPCDEPSSHTQQGDFVPNTQLTLQTNVYRSDVAGEYKLF